MATVRVSIAYNSVEWGDTKRVWSVGVAADVAHACHIGMHIMGFGYNRHVSH